VGFCLGNAIKYIWRADLKHNDGGLEDLQKARWYIEREIARRKLSASTANSNHGTQADSQALAEAGGARDV